MKAAPTCSPRPGPHRGRDRHHRRRPGPRAGDPTPFDARTAGARDVKAAASAAGLRWPVAT
ncbi:hypothetical protein RAA17_14310 [Komagataeibacter rhaeticus]|nr:hypothetical protein [Komagataeibacter rhaeticus]